MRRIAILAGSLREANAYCVDKGIRATFAKSAAQIRMADHIIQLPGFNQRRDRFALAAARDARVKYGKDIRLDIEDEWTAPKQVVETVSNAAPAPRDEEHPFDQVDLADEAVQEQLKIRLNAVGLTLKKLPKKAAN